MRIEIRYQTRAGAWRVMPRAERTSLYETLLRLRKHGVKAADVWTVDDYDALIERIGGIDEIEGADNPRIKYQVWCER